MSLSRWAERWRRLWHGPNADNLLPEKLYVVTISETEVCCRAPSGETACVTWDGLGAVLIETDDTGPWGMDFLWMLLGEHDGCVIPQGATGEAALLERLQALPGFDNEAVIAANSCVENQRFLCWQRGSPSELAG
jgi:hypothetical protein